MKSGPYNCCGPGGISPEATNYKKGGLEGEKIKPSVRYIIILYVVYCQVILLTYATQIASRRNNSSDNKL